MNRPSNEPVVCPDTLKVSSRRPQRIFIVEDESMVTMLIEDTLADLGYEVAGATHRRWTTH
jgi:hypothetical protein